MKEGRGEQEGGEGREGGEGNKEGKKGRGGTKSPLCANGYPLSPLTGRLPNSASVLGLLLGELFFCFVVVV